MPFRLARADQDMLHAELRGADFGIYLAVRLRPEVLADAEAALATTLHAWPSLLARVARAGAEFVMVPDAPERIDAGTLASLASTEPLAGRTILAARGGRLLRYRLDVDAGRLELLTHHLVLDADSLAAFLADLDLALGGAALPATTEWPWGEVEDRDLVMPTADQPLVPTSLPAPGTHRRRALSEADSERIEAAAKSCGATTFAILWAAGARLGEGNLGAVVSNRITGTGPLRTGNATAYLSVATTAHGTAREQVRAAFDDLVATWSGSLAPAIASGEQVLVSMSQVPTSTRWQAIGGIDLGGYVVKYPRHIQVQSDGDRLVVEAYAQHGADALLGTYLTLLEDLLTECLGPRRTPAQELPALTVPAPPQACPSTVDPLSRILAAAPESELRDLGISSLDVLSILEGLGERFGVRVGVDTFYAWENAGDVQRAAAGEATKAAEPEPSVPTGPGVLAHLNDIFIDAFRRTAPMTGMPWSTPMSCTQGSPRRCRPSRRCSPTCSLGTRSLRRPSPFPGMGWC